MYRKVSYRLFSTKDFSPIIEKGYAGVSQWRQKALKTSSELSENTEVEKSEKSEKLLQLSLKPIIDQFNGVSTTIGYGSGVFPQNGYTKAQKPQIDMVHVVDNTEKFHRQNLKRFPGHYSGLKYLGLGAIEYIQNIGAGIYYNPFVEMNGAMIKYGVMATKTAIKDIVEWKHLYIAGRLQKPVKIISTSSEIEQLNSLNLYNAAVVSILLIDKPSFTKTQLYETITLLSYLGDPRMQIGGENPHKVKNIVSKQLKEFDNIYEPILSFMHHSRMIIFTGDTISVVATVNEKIKLLQQLPINFRLNFIPLTNNQDLATLVASNKLPNAIKSTLKKIVSTPSLIQSVKGIFTAGIYKSVTYVIQKRLKYTQG